MSLGVWNVSISVAGERIPGYDLGDERIPEEPMIDGVLDVWYGFVGDHAFLLEYFADAETGEPIDDYLERVRRCFGRWIRDTCDTPYDEAWLDYQFEIGRRHRDEKNGTDDGDSVDVIHQRYLIAFVYPITATIREFRENGDHDDETVANMYHAWFKSVTLQVTLWTYPYTDDW